MKLHRSSFPPDGEPLHIVRPVYIEVEGGKPVPHWRRILSDPKRCSGPRKEGIGPGRGCHKRVKPSPKSLLDVCGRGG